MEPRSIAPAGLDVKSSPEVGAAIRDVRDDSTSTTWLIVGYGAGGDIKQPLCVIATGSGEIDEMREHFDDSQPLYALYRTSDVYDDIKTVKFVYIYWFGSAIIYSEPGQRP